MKTCEGCHGDASSRHAGTTVENIINRHPQLACQVCHIPTFARKVPTKTEWYWETAGDLETGVVTDPDMDRPVYDPKKGSFVWASNVRPTLRYFDQDLSVQEDERQPAGRPQQQHRAGAAPVRHQGRTESLLGQL